MRCNCWWRHFSFLSSLCRIGDFCLLKFCFQCDQELCRLLSIFSWILLVISSTCAFLEKCLRKTKDGMQLAAEFD